MDQDLLQMNIGQLCKEVMKLRNALRDLRDQQNHDMCWFNPEIFEILPEGKEKDKTTMVPPACQFIENCAIYRQTLTEGVSLEEMIKHLQDPEIIAKIQEKVEAIKKKKICRGCIK